MDAKTVATTYADQTLWTAETDEGKKSVRDVVSLSGDLIAKGTTLRPIVISGYIRSLVIASGPGIYCKWSPVMQGYIKENVVFTVKHPSPDLNHFVSFSIYWITAENPFEESKEQTKKVIPAYPHKCPVCSNNALVMFSTIECTGIGCRYFKLGRGL